MDVIIDLQARLLRIEREKASGDLELAAAKRLICDLYLQGKKLEANLLSATAELFELKDSHGALSILLADLTTRSHPTYAQPIPKVPSTKVAGKSRLSSSSNVPVPTSENATPTSTSNRFQLLRSLNDGPSAPNDPSPPSLPPPT